MRRIAFFFLIFLAGCAETYLQKSEERVLQSSVIHRTDNLAVMSDHSKDLADAYVEAAGMAAKGQDIAALVTFLSAAGFVHGAVVGASNVALANTALVGAGSTTIASRTLSKASIEGIYQSAKRMNCVATASGMGAFLLDGYSSRTLGIARAATYGAIEEIKIITREALVREVADFVQIRDDFIEASTLTEDQARSLESRTKMSQDELLALNQYLSILDNCIGAIASATAVGKVDGQ